MQLDLDEPVELLFDGISGLSRTLRSSAHRWENESSSLRRSDVVLLRLLVEQDEWRPGDIAQRLGLNPSVISRQLGALEVDGIVERRVDPCDGRAGLVKLSEAGHLELRAMRDHYIESFKAQLTGWDRQKIIEAAAVLKELIQALRPDSSSTDKKNTETKEL